MTTRSADECEMSRSCQSATFSRPTSAFARTTRARPQMRSATTGLRLCGIADEPFWPFAERLLHLGAPRCGRGAGSRARTRRATRRRRASAVSSSAWRSRWMICVELGAGSRPSRSQAMRSSSGSVAQYVPTAPESLPTRIPSSARARRSRFARRARTPSRRASGRTSSARRGRRACGRSGASRGAPRRARRPRRTRRRARRG